MNVFFFFLISVHTYYLLWLAFNLMNPAKTLYYASSVFSGVQQPAAGCVNNVPLRGSTDILPWPVSNTGGSVSLRRAAVLHLQHL